MSEGDKERWDAKYRERGEGVAKPPSELLRELGERLPAQGRALDLAGGEGRHAIWLARRGLEVTLADVSAVALGRADAAARLAGVELRTVEVDLEAPGARPAGPWDLIVVFHYLQRDLFEWFAEALAPGGTLVYAQPTVTNLERHPRPSRRFLLADGELGDLARGAGLAVALHDEAWRVGGQFVARLVAKRRAAV